MTTGDWPLAWHVHTANLMNLKHLKLSHETIRELSTELDFVRGGQQVVYGSCAGECFDAATHRVGTPPLPKKQK